jgi:hypothetical protein
MKRLTLYTEMHTDKLQSFINKAPVIIHSRGYKGRLFYIRFTYDPQEPYFTDAFICFLEDIVLFENPIYRHSPKLRDAAKNMHRSPVHTQAGECLRRYLRHNKTLHVEGYTAFRMEEYKYRLDMLMYGLIKKYRITPL